jgi:hypothetical protein
VLISSIFLLIFGQVGATFTVAPLRLPLYDCPFTVALCKMGDFYLKFADSGEGNRKGCPYLTSKIHQKKELINPKLVFGTGGNR